MAKIFFISIFLYLFFIYGDTNITLTYLSVEIKYRCGLYKEYSNGVLKWLSICNFLIPTKYAVLENVCNRCVVIHIIKNTKCTIWSLYLHSKGWNCRNNIQRYFDKDVILNCISKRGDRIFFKDSKLLIYHL